MGGRIVREFGDGNGHTAIFKMNNQQGLIVQHMEVCSMLCGSLNGDWGRMDTCIYMAESLCCSPKTVTALLISYMSIQIKSFFLKKKKVIFCLSPCLVSEGTWYQFVPLLEMLSLIICLRGWSPPYLSRVKISFSPLK